MQGKRPGLSTAQARRSDVASKATSILAVRWLHPVLDGRLTRLDKARIVLGREPDCDVVLEGTETSRRHAEVVREGQFSMIRDLGSTNGVFVNGVQVLGSQLGSGAILRLGEWIGVVTAICAEAEQTPVFERDETGLLSGPVLRPVLRAAKSAAATSLNLILEGETGTGKEVVARAVHAWSGRRGPYVAVNCAALPESLVEAELFGHGKGAYTGADRARPGMFRSAEGGTLVLDEIADLPLTIQTKLLRVLQEREVLPVGESTPVKIDVRIIATAQGPLYSNVQAGRFRADLFGRLDEATIRIPPLRARIEEVPFLFFSLLQRHCLGARPPVEPSLVEQLCLHDWPFNVREMDSLVRRLIALHGAEPLLLKTHLPDRMLGQQPSEAPAAPRAPSGPGADPPARGEAGAQPDQDRDARDVAALLDALRAHEGNVARAAASAGISRQRAYRLISSHSALDLDALRSKKPGC